MNKAGILLVTTFLLSGSAMAEPVTIPAQEILDRYNRTHVNTATGLFILVLLALVLIMLQVLDMRSILKRIQAAKEAAAGVIKTRATWWQVFHIKGQKLDEDVEGHTYDGIKEYDNNPPAWFNWLFYGTAVFAVLYMLYYHVFNLGTLPAEQYAIQQKEAEKVVAAAQEKAIRFAEEPPYKDAEHIELGKQTFISICASCHGDKGQGLAGPNLTDEFWIHGGKYSDIFKTIFNGVPEKGMPTWKTALQPEELRSVASYLHSIRNTNQPSALPPQGEKYIGETASR
jgi:cytochrome c oxidase cbb3-type subunit 3